MTSLSEVPATLLGLVEHYGPSGQEAPAVAWLVERMRALGFNRAYTDPVGNAVGVVGAGPRQVILLGHIDTIPGQIPPRLEGDDFYGRGTVDAKGPLAAFVDAAAQVGPLPGWEIVVIGALREEVDSIGARYAAGQYRPDFAVIGEPSRWDRITLGYKGTTWVQVTARKTLSHTARREESACEMAVAAWARISAWAETFNQGREAAFDQLFVSLRGFDSGDDGFEEWASLRVGLRLPLDLTPTSAIRGLSAAAAPLQLDVQGDSIPAYRCDKNNALVRAFLQSVRAQGGKPGFLLKTGTADLNIVAPLWRCPALAYGPGDSTFDHTPNEHISITEYTRSVQVLATVLKSLATA